MRMIRSGRMCTMAAAISLLITAFPVTGYADVKNNDYSKGHTDYEFFDIEISVPESWTYSVNDELARYEFEIPSGGTMFVAQFPLEDALDKKMAGEIADYYFEDGYEIDESHLDEYAGEGFSGYIKDFELEGRRGDYNATCLVVGGEDCAWLFGCIAVEDIDMDRDLTRIFDSLVFPSDVLKEEAEEEAPASGLKPNAVEATEEATD